VQVAVFLQRVGSRAEVINLSRDYGRYPVGLGLEEGFAEVKFGAQKRTLEPRARLPGQGKSQRGNRNFGIERYGP